MRKLLALAAAGLLVTTSLASAGQLNEPDQRWLQAVEKKIASGQMQVSTPAPARVTLLKEWAAKNGYSVQVTKTETSFQLELSKSVARQ